VLVIQINRDPELQCNHLHLALLAILCPVLKVAFAVDVVP
jgi:hypothetical protein